MASGTKIGDVYYDVDVDTSDLDKKLTDAGVDAGTKGGTATGHAFGKSSAGVISRWAKVIVAGFVARGAFNLVKDTIGQASDLNESVTKIDAVFGDASDSVMEWSKDSSTAFGQSQQQALEAAGTYGNLFQAFGIGREDAQGMSQSLVELASDMASFNNTSVDEALLALRSGLTGEMEPMKKYGSVLSDVRLKQKAFEMGLISSVEDGLTPAAKAQAAYALVMQDTAMQQGDFERTSGGLANQQKILSAEWKNMQATIGSQLLPMMKALVGYLIDTAIPALMDVAKWVKGAFIWLVENEHVLIGIGAAIATLFIAWAIEAGKAALATLLASAPLLLLALALGVLTAAVIWAYQNWGWFRDAVDAVGRWFRDVLWPILLDVFGWMQENIPIILQTVADYFMNTLLPAAQNAFNWLRDNVGPILQGIADFFNNVLLPAAQTAFNWLRDNVPGILGSISDFITNTFLPAVQTAFNWINDNVIPIIQKVADWIMNVMIPALSDWYEFLLTKVWPIVINVAEYLSGYWTFAMGVAQQAVENVTTVVTTLYDWIQTLWDRMEGFRGFILGWFITALQVNITVFGTYIGTIIMIWGWIKQWWDLMADFRSFLTGPFVTALGLLDDKIMFLVRNSIGQFMEVLGTLRGILEGVRGFLTGPFNGALATVGGGFGTVAGAIGRVVDALRDVISWAGRALGPLKSVIDLAGKAATMGGGLLGGGILGGIFGSATGGPIRSGDTHVVGENGPELFTARKSGWIVPNNGDYGRPAETSSGGISIGSISVTITGVNGQVDANMVRTSTEQGVLSALGQYIRARG